MQIYAVLYEKNGCFILTKKLEKGYFFYNSNTNQGDIVPSGQELNGGGNYALPGGKLNKNESISEGAAREFLEETGVDIKGFQASECDFCKFGAGYFLASSDEIKCIHQRIHDYNLDAATKASEDIINKKISKYPEIHQCYPYAPVDNELETVYIWNINNEDNWNAIQKWAETIELNWYYAILLYLRNNILKQKM